MKFLILPLALLASVLGAVGCSTNHVSYVSPTGATLDVQRVSVLQDTEIGKIHWGDFDLEGGKTVARTELLKMLAELSKP
jgi:hypothetical protein